MRLLSPTALKTAPAGAAFHGHPGRCHVISLWLARAQGIAPNSVAIIVGPRNLLKTSGYSRCPSDEYRAALLGLKGLDKERKNDANAPLKTTNLSHLQ